MEGEVPFFLSSKSRNKKAEGEKNGEDFPFFTVKVKMTATRLLGKSVKLLSQLNYKSKAETEAAGGFPGPSLSNIHTNILAS